jgi:hypothetical protein
VLQQINLLSDELRRRKEPLTFTHLLVLWAAFGVALALFTGWDGLSLWQLNAKHELNEEQSAMLARANEALKAAFDSKLDPKLKQQVDELRAEQLEQQQLMNLLVGYKSDHEGGFSAYLGDLSDYAVDGMWLNEIVFEEGGTRIHLKGMTTEAVHLPEFLQSLSEGASFSGHQFDDFEIRESASGVLEFDIRGPHEVVSG